MRTPLPPLNWFRAFEASARHLSFTAAAAEIGMTQSAVSQQIRGLESKLQVTLFERRNRRLFLTDEGRTLLPVVEEALGKLSRAVDRFESAQGQRVLMIRASSSVVEWIVAPALPAFRRAYPNISLRFITAIWPDQFHQSDADVDIRFGSRKQAGREAVEILPNRLMAVRAPHLTGALDEVALIEAVGISDGWAKWGQTAGLQGLTPTLFVDSYGLGLRLAVEANGVALVNEGLARHALRDGSLVAAHETRIDANEGFYLSTKPDSEDALAFGAWITGELHPDSA